MTDIKALLKKVVAQFEKTVIVQPLNVQAMTRVQEAAKEAGRQIRDEKE